MNERFLGVKNLYGDAAFEILKKSHVLIVGVGGVGSWTAEALGRFGVGELTLCDLDEVCITNTNRQIQALTSTVGKMKIHVLADRLRDINPDIIVNVIEDFVTRDNASEILTSATFDFVFDAIDQVWVKCTIIRYCYRNKLPILTCGGASGMTDPVGLRIEDLNRCHEDPLLRFCRSNLRRKFAFPKQIHKKWRVPAVYLPHQRPLKECSSDQSEEDTYEHCAAGLGSSIVMTGSMGFLAAGYIVDRLTASTRMPTQKPWGSGLL